MIGTRNILTYCGVAIVSFILPSCKDNPAVPPQTKHVVITGNVGVLADDETLLTAEQGGIVVALDSTGFTAITDSLGNWHLIDVPAGTYDVSISRSNYVTTRLIDYSFTRDSTFFFSSVGSRPDFNVTEMSDSVNGVTIIITGSVSGTASYARNVMVCLGLDSTVSNEHFQFYEGYHNVEPGSSTFTVWMTTDHVKREGSFTTGMTVYVAAYGYGFGSYLLNKETYSVTRLSVSPVPVRSKFVMP